MIGTSNVEYKLEFTKEIYLVLSYTGTLLSKTIRYITHENYAHVSLCLEDTFRHMYSFGRKYPSNPIIAGLVTEDLFSGVFTNKDSRCLIYKIKVTDSQYNALKSELNRFMAEQPKYKYNFAGLISLKMNKGLKRRYHYFCSQFVSEVLKNSNIADNLNKDSALIKPCDLLDLDNKSLVYEGTILDFQNMMMERHKI